MRLSLGIDQSYTSTGYCLTDVDTGIVHSFGKFSSTTSSDVYVRSMQVGDFISSLVRDNPVTSINIEGLAFGIRGDATRDLAGLIFVIITTLLKSHPTIPYVIHAPTSVKKRATGSGKSDKNAMIAHLPAGLEQKIKDAGYKKTTGLADIADAYWLSVMNK